MKDIYVGDARLHVEDQGAGPPLLLVHGFPLDHSMWKHQIRQFAGKYQVIAPDLRGFGGSDIPHETVSMDDFADDLVTLLDGLHVEKAVFCGLSMGGYIGFRFAERYPERLTGLILCDTRAVPDSAEAAAGRETTAQMVLTAGMAQLSQTMLQKLFAPATLKANTDEVVAMREVMENAHPEGVAAALRGMAIRPDSTALLSHIKVPTLVIVGEHDAISPPDEMETIAKAIPGAEFLQVPAAGHMAPLEQPEPVNEAIAQFLEAHSPAR